MKKSPLHRIAERIIRLKPIISWNGDMVQEMHRPIDREISEDIVEMVEHSEMFEQQSERRVRSHVEWLFAPWYCFEILEGNRVCMAPVEREDQPCSRHHPDNAAHLGHCTYPERLEFYPGDPLYGRREGGRMCQEKPDPGSDRCQWHERRCRVVMRNGKVCDRRDCTIPAHFAKNRTAGAPDDQ